jgi:hypothetical protein
VCVWRLELLPRAVPVFVAAAAALAAGSMCVNMAAKTHQLVRLLEFAVVGDGDGDGDADADSVGGTQPVASNAVAAAAGGMALNDVTVAAADTSRGSAGASVTTGTARDRLAVFRNERRLYLTLAALLVAVAAAVCGYAVVLIQ